MAKFRVSNGFKAVDVKERNAHLAVEAARPQLKNGYEYRVKKHHDPKVYRFVVPIWVDPETGEPYEDQYL